MGKSLIDDISEARRDNQYRKTYDKRDGLEQKARTEAHWKPHEPKFKTSPRIVAAGGSTGYHMTPKAKTRITLPKVWK